MLLVTLMKIAIVTLSLNTDLPGALVAVFALDFGGFLG